MSKYLPPNELIDHPEYIQIDIRPDHDGGHKMSKVTHYTRVPSELDDGWENIIYFRRIGSHQQDESRKNGLGGFVYILTNERYPGNCKIGFTTSSPQYRLQQINGAGVVDDWELAFYYKCSRPYDCEQAIHLKLSNVRLRNDREFFEVGLNEAIGVIREMGPMFGPL